MRLVATGFLVASLTAGCVSKSRYVELENQYDTAVAERDAAQAVRDTVKNDLQEVEEKGRKRLAEFSAVHEELLKIQVENLAKVKVDDGRAVLELDSDTLFASGSAELTPAGVSAVQGIAQALASRTDGRFQVEGHADGDPIENPKEFPSHWHLGADRAINVVTAMVEAGFPPERLSAATFASDDDTPEAEQARPRIAVVWMPQLSG